MSSLWPLSGTVRQLRDRAVIVTDSLIRFVDDPDFLRLLVRGQLVFQRLIAALRARNRR